MPENEEKSAKPKRRKLRKSKRKKTKTADPARVLADSMPLSQKTSAVYGTRSPIKVLVNYNFLNKNGELNLQNSRNSTGNGTGVIQSHSFSVERVSPKAIKI